MLHPTVPRTWAPQGHTLIHHSWDRHARLKRPVFLIWDRFSGHKKAARLRRDIYGHRIHVAFLPAYAPELNVVEQAWGHTKYGERANCIPQDSDDLAHEVAHSLSAKHHRRDLLNAFSQPARLELCGEPFMGSKISNTPKPQNC
jgi:putative transposase